MTNLDNGSPQYHKPKWFSFFVTVSLFGMVGLGSILALGAWWAFQPVHLPTVDQPIEINNENREIYVGDPILMTLVVNRPRDYQTIETQRFIECPDSGKLQPMTDGEARTLPSGSYTLEVDNVVLPGPVLDGDACRFLFRNTYEINPLRDEIVEFRSEFFTVYN